LLACGGESGVRGRLARVDAGSCPLVLTNFPFTALVSYPVLENLIADVRFALRWLRRSPAFTLIAAASLAIGIGFNTALFTIVDALVFRPLPVEQVDRRLKPDTTDVASVFQ